MRVVKDCRFDQKNAIAIGTFDGLHKAHRKIIDIVKKEAAALGGNSLVYTFFGLPSAYFGGESQALFTKEEKLAAFEKTGVDFLYIIDFSKNLSNISREKFADYLIKDLNAGAIVVGYNFRFGTGVLGTPDFLKEYAARSGVRVRIADPVKMLGEPVSSTRIREALRKGDVSLAEALLGRPYSLRGVIMAGDKLGRTLGFPTANMEVPDGKLLPSRGVYLTMSEYGGKIYPSITNIGVRPTVSEERKVTVETHIIGFSENIYGKTLNIQFLRRLREEQRFQNAAALGEQLEKDKSRATAYFAERQA